MRLREKTVKAHIVFSLWILLVSVAGAMSAKAQSLQETVLYALENHPKIEGARASEEAARHERMETRSHYFPELIVGVTAGRIYQDNATSRGLSVTRGASYSGYGESNIAVRQMLYDAMETSHKSEAAQAREQSHHFNILDTQRKIASEVVQNYIDILRLRSALQLLDEQSKELEDYRERIKDMAANGISDESKLQQARDVAMVIDSLRADYEGRLIVAEAGYTQAVGRHVPDKMIIPESMRELVEKDLDKVIAQAKANHPQVRAAYLQSDAARYDVEAEEGRLYPDLSGEISHYKADKKDVIGGESQDSRAVLKMNWAFSTGGKEVSAIRRKRSEYHEATHKTKEIKRKIEREIREAYARYLTFWRKSKLSIERVELNKKLMSTYQSQFKGARINLLDLMRAQSQLFKAELEKNDNIFNLLSAQYSVLAARGELIDVILAESLPAAGKQRKTE